jgi:histidinol-phosphate aminotransferase
MTLVPKHIQLLQAYKAGKPIEEVQRELGIQKIVKLASNENPLGVAPNAFKAMERALKNAHRYPAPDGYSLRKALAEKFNVTLENVFLGHGSEGIISVMMRTFPFDDEEALTSEGSFITFPLQAQSRGLKLVKAPLKDYKIDLNAILERITPKTKLIYLANPNNPTGTIFKVHEFLDFVKKVPKKALVIMDQAYYEFAAGDPAYPDSMQYRFDNTITLRTFSKSHGLAGLRLGYGFGNKHLIDHLMKVKLSFEPSSIAIAAGVGALQDHDFLEKTLHTNQVVLKMFYELFEKHGIRYIPSHANFVTIILDSEKSAHKMFDKLLREGVIVRPLKAFGLPHCVRISTGTEAEGQFFVDAFEKVI